MIEVIPAILEKNFPEIEKKIKLVEGLVDWVQIDILDNTLMPNNTFLDPLPYLNIKSHINLELHMMVRDPLLYLERFTKAGFKRFFAHIEGDHIDEYIEECNRLGVEIGLAIDGPTPVEKIQKYINDIDVILVMAIDAGFSGRPFREDTIEKIKKIKDMVFDLPIAVDGAMDGINARRTVEAGATRINSNSFIFSSKDIDIAIQTLSNL